jgi:hypothetical protein
MRAYAALCTALLARSAAAVVAGDVDVEAADDPAASPAQQLPSCEYPRY